MREQFSKYKNDLNSSELFARNSNLALWLHSSLKGLPGKFLKAEQLYQHDMESVHRPFQLSQLQFHRDIESAMRWMNLRVSKVCRREGRGYLGLSFFLWVDSIHQPRPQNKIVSFISNISKKSLRGRLTEFVNLVNFVNFVNLVNKVNLMKEKKRVTFLIKE